MDYKVLYRKYRPDDFSGLIGQDYTSSILKNTIQTNKISHAYIFSGTRGTGKTSTAKIFAKAINCLNPTENGPCNECDSCKSFKENADIIEIDAASNNGVDEIREIINNIKLAPSYSKYKVYIIDEVHMLSTSAFNALLLTLEEPPKHIVFILATTNIESVPITILSRCQRFDFHKIALTDIINRLNYVAEQEKIDIEEEAIEEIAYISEGGMRDALSILDQLSSNNGKITINEVISHFGSVSKKQINDLYTCILENNVGKYDDMMKNFKALAIDYKLLIKKLLEKIEEEAINSKKDFDYKGLPYTLLKDMAFSLAEISSYVSINIDPYLLIEISLLKYFPTEKAEETEKTEVKNISQEIIEEPKSNQDTENHLINIRINNCFVNAKKEYLQKLKNDWPDFINSIDNKMILNLLIDSDIAASSDKVAIITNPIIGTVNLINKNIEEISKLFFEKEHTDYKFIAITENRWQKEKDKYINNIKNKIVYEYINEPELEAKSENQNNSLEETAFNIFDKNKIEIE